MIGGKYLWFTMIIIVPRVQGVMQSQSVRNAFVKDGARREKERTLLSRMLTRNAKAKGELYGKNNRSLHLKCFISFSDISNALFNSATHCNRRSK